MAKALRPVSFLFLSAFVIFLFIRLTTSRLLPPPSRQSSPAVAAIPTLAPATATSSPEAVYVWNSVLPTPTPFPTLPPTPTPAPYPDLVVAAIEPMPSGPYLNLLWSPDGKKALVSKNYVTHRLVRNQDAQNNPEAGAALGVSIGLGDLWLVDLATNSEKLLRKQVGRYTWSPKENKVAYISPTEKEGIDGALYILDVDMGTTKELTKVDFLGSDYDPQWLPTDQIVFVREGQVWSIAADGQQEPIQLTWEFLSWVAAAARPGKVDPKPDAIKQFQFSPTGKRIAYLIPHESEFAIASQLWLANADGTEPIFVTGQAIGYVWSPDGTQLSLLTYRDLDDPVLDERLPPHRELWLVSADGKNRQLIYHFQGWGGPTNITWAPDNTKLLFLQLEFVENGSLSTVWIADLGQERKIGVVANMIEMKNHINGVWWEPNGNSLIVTEEPTGNEQGRSSKRIIFQQ